MEQQRGRPEITWKHVALLTVLVVGLVGVVVAVGLLWF